MSNNAYEAYFEGRAPLSGWTKSKLLAALRAAGSDGERLAACAVKNKMPVAFLRSALLECRGEWHHTSKFFNVTMFYQLYEELDWITNEDLLSRFAEWKSEHSRELAAKKQKKQGTARYGKLLFDMWVGTRNYGRYKTFEKTGWVRREERWYVVYAEKECKTILTRRLEGSNSCPRFVAAGDDNNNQ